VSGGPAPRAAYRRLLAAYGPQGWWPVTRAGASRPAYEPRRARALTEAERVEVCVGAILTQNTAWTNVETALASLRGALPRPTWAGLAALPAARLARAVRSSGYFRQKARKLKVLAAFARGRRASTREWLGAGGVEERRAELLGLWGVGPETADSILLYAGDRPAFVIDAYTRRIGARLGWWRDPSHDEARAWLVARLPHDRELYAEFHALLVRHAKEHCRVRPDCGGCPLRRSCAHARGGVHADPDGPPASPRRRPAPARRRR
jgi:endonuclease-3 related protein